MLSLRHLRARLNAEEAGWLLGFTKEEITILVAKKILKPLGNPSINGRESFSAAEILRLGETPPRRRRFTTLTGFESIGPGSNLGPVPKTVPSCSHVLGPKHVLIVLDYSVERCKTDRQIKQDSSESHPLRQ